MVRFYFLPRFYCWRLSCYDLSTEVSRGKGRVSHSHSLGIVPHLDYIMLRLPWLVRSAILPWFAGIRNLPYVHVDRWELLQEE